MGSFQIKEALTLFQNYHFQGNAEMTITEALGIQDALVGEHVQAVSWINDKNSASVDPQQVNLGLLILTKTTFHRLNKPSGNFLVVDNPRAAFFQVIEKFFSEYE